MAGAVLLLGGVTILLLGCGEQVATDVPPGSAAVEVRSFFDRNDSSLRQAHRAVLTDEVAWQQMWDALRGGSVLPAQPPYVDFDEDMVVFASLGVRACCWAVEIGPAYATDRRLYVVVQERWLSCNPADTTATAPVAAAVVPRSDRWISFLERRVEQGCQPNPGS